MGAPLNHGKTHPPVRCGRARKSPSIAVGMDGAVDTSPRGRCPEFGGERHRPDRKPCARCRRRGGRTEHAAARLERTRSPRVGCVHAYRFTSGRVPRAALTMSLEPSPEDFARRDAAGLCVACGENPQPARKDSGDSPTHHRCDPCWKRYQSLKNLRDRMLDGENWGLAPDGEARPCGLCGGNIPAAAYSIFTSTIIACLACVEAAGFIEALTVRGANVAPMLQHAVVETVSVLNLKNLTNGEQKAVDEGWLPNMVAVTFPPAIPAMIVLALHMGRKFLARGVLCACGPRARAVEFKVSVQIGSQEPDVCGLVSDITSELVTFCACVKVPRAFYRAARNMVYETHGNPLARRLKRLPVN